MRCPAGASVRRDGTVPAGARKREQGTPPYCPLAATRCFRPGAGRSPSRKDPDGGASNRRRRTNHGRECHFGHGDRRKSQSPRHHRGDPHPEAGRKRRPARDPRRKTHAGEIRRVRGGRIETLSRPGFREIQGSCMAIPRRGIEITSHHRRIRFGQTHHIQCVLHLSRGGAGDARRSGRSGRASRCHSAGAGLRHREFPGPGTGGHAVRRRRTRCDLRPDRTPQTSGPSDPDREFPRYEAARRGVRCRDRQSAIRRCPAGTSWHQIAAA